MRLLTVVLESIYSFSSDSEEEKAKKQKQRADRAKRLAEIGITVFKRDDDEYEDAPVLGLTEKQYIDVLQAKIGVSKVKSIADAGSGLDPQGAIEQVTRLIEKMEKFATNVSNMQYNEKVEVYTPGMALMLFNHVKLLEDACSDQLQGELDAGWKIIAACPQPNQRRPDYILGRYDPHRADELGKDSYAARGYAPPQVPLQTPPDSGEFL
jgi:hypothetical protein